MKRLVFLLLLIAPVLVAAAEPQVDRDDVLRRGNSVEHVTDMIQAGDDIYDPLATPKNDKGKWFISVLIDKDNAMSQRLVNDWKVQPRLLAFANPQSSKDSWAHFTIYDRRSGLQNFRWPSVRTDVVPTIWIQAPRDGSFGDSSVVVAQFTYDGQPDVLADKMRDAILYYSQRYHEAMHPEGHRQQDLITDCPNCPWPQNQPAPPAVTPTGPFEFPPARPTDGGLPDLTKLLSGDIGGTLQAMFKIVLWLLFGGGGIYVLERITGKQIIPRAAKPGSPMTLSPTVVPPTPATPTTEQLLAEVLAELRKKPTS